MSEVCPRDCPDRAKLEKLRDAYDALDRHKLDGRPFGAADMFALVSKLTAVANAARELCR